MENLKDLKTLALKNRVITIGTLIICTLMIIGFIWFKTPATYVNTAEIIELEASRQAIQRQNAALLRLSEEQKKTTLFYQQRDSILQLEFKLNRKAIEKIKIPNEIYFKRFDNYSSDEWSSYFANLPEPER